MFSWPVGYSSNALIILLSIQGAGGMLGGGCALQLAQYGARLALIDIDAAKLETIINKCQSAGLQSDKIVSMVGDVTKVEDAQEIVQKTVKAFGKITNVVRADNQTLLSCHVLY